VIYALIGCLLGAGPLTPIGNLEIVPDDDPTRVVVRYLLPPGAAAPAVGPVDEATGRRHLVFGLPTTDDASPTPVFGTYEFRDGVLSFRPRFGLVRGSAYRAWGIGPGTSGADANVMIRSYQVPEVDAGPPTTVVVIKPAGEVLPANVLRFAITFSRPMREGREVLERIHLLDDAGKELGAPWRDIELWNENATRLSLYIHPGRIKQGVNLRDEFGPVLEPGRRYTLVVGADLRDARGVPLGKEFRREFRTSEEVRSRIEIAVWKLSSVAAGTREPLVVGFDRPIDAYLPVRCLAVSDAGGRTIDTAIEVADDQRSCRLTPREPWRAEELTLVVDPILEDLAGNTPVRAFDHDRTAKEASPPVLRRGFRPK
jgi:hypothetical protein